MSELKNVDGIWTAPEHCGVSYPVEGYSRCFQVEESSYWFQYRNKMILDTFRSYVLRDVFVNNVLDLGGGNGFVAKAFKDLGFHTVLVEPGYGAINAKKRGIDSIYMCSIKDIPSSLSFDVIGIFDVIEHIESSNEFLLQASSHLNQGGRLLLTVPTYQALWSSEDIVAGHYRRYTLKSLSAELEQAGFEVTYYSYFFFTLLAPIFLFRRVPFILKTWMERGDDSFVIDAKNDLVAKGLMNRIVSFLLNCELRLIRFFGRFPCGSSLIVVAKKKEA